MKVLHRDVDGYLIVLMDETEWMTATGDEAPPATGAGAVVQNVDQLRRRLKQAYDRLTEFFGPGAT